MKKIPVNIITGFLGVGKTTAILHFLKNKTEHGKWAVLVNEFGEVSIDGPVIRQATSDEVEVKEVSGGCMCCVGKVMFDMALAQVIGKLKPDRLIIEPSGLGHIQEITKTLKKKSYEDIVEVMAPICLVDPRYLQDDTVTASMIFDEQVKYAEIIVANKVDLCKKAEIDHFKMWAEKLVPTKKHVLQVTHGEIPQQMLTEPLTDYDNDAQFEIVGVFHEKPTVEDEKITQNEQGIIKKTNSIGDYSGAGWVFPRHIKFNKTKFISLVYSMDEIIRLKGIVQTDFDWYAINKTMYNAAVSKCEPANEGRVEVIFHKSFKKSAEKFEGKLFECIVV